MLCDYHAGVCNRLMIDNAARYPLMICCNLSATLPSVKHILQDVNRKAQNRTCKLLQDLSTAIGNKPA